VITTISMYYVQHLLTVQVTQGTSAQCLPADKGTGGWYMQV
jgi:hypothetical protein